jgi:hypothetical protein
LTSITNQKLQLPAYIKDAKISLFAIAGFYLLGLITKTVGK